MITLSMPFLPPLTRLIGRQQEVRTACELLTRPSVRVLTLTGPGGVGKTHLGLHLANEIQTHFQNGVSFLSLASVQHPSLFFSTLAQALRLPSHGTLSLEEEIAAALHKQHMLLFLDNFEHLIEVAPSLIPLLSSCPQVKLLVTSRQPLHIRGEYTLSLPSLTLPAPEYWANAEEVAHSEAGELFLERAQALFPQFQLTEESAPCVAAICQRLDRLPLAIELAIPQLQLFTLPDLLTKLEQRLPLLINGPRDLPARQRTLRDTLAWSYQLLSEEEQHYFRWLSVCESGFTLAAATEITRIDKANSTDSAKHILALLNTHLLYRREHSQAEPRLEMFEIMREYGKECLHLCQEEAAARDAHARYYQHYAEQAALHLLGTEQEQWFEKLAYEQPNIRAALHWLLQHAEVKQEVVWKTRACSLAISLLRFWIVRGAIQEGRMWLERVLQISADVEPGLRARAAMGMGWFAFIQGEVGQAEVWCKGSLRLYQESSEIQGMAWPLQWLGWIAMHQGDQLDASVLLEKSRTLSWETGEMENAGYLLHFLADVALEQGNLEHAHRLLRESERLFQQMNHQDGQAWAWRSIGRLLFQQEGDPDLGRAVLERSLQVSERIHHQGGIACSLHLLGRIAHVRRNFPLAQELLEKSLSLFRTLALPQAIALVLSQLASVLARQGENARANSLYEESLMIFQQVNDPLGLAFCLQEWGLLLAQQGHDVWAARFWGAADARRTRSHHTDPYQLRVECVDAEQLAYEQVKQAVINQLGKQAFTQAWQEGQTLPLDSLMKQQRPCLAISSDAGPMETGKRKQSHLIIKDALTRREQEVLHLVSQGMTDAQVAETLVISIRTVNAHLRTIYKKINVSSRYAAARYMQRQSIV
ncbi:MAG TPA: tetratricopeptide repeat protein [Ktedonobacteraceae bacterium]